MPIQLPDLSLEEWDTLERLARGGAEAKLTPPLMVELFVRLGLAVERRDGPAITYAGKQLLLKRQLHGQG